MGLIRKLLGLGTGSPPARACPEADRTPYPAGLIMRKGEVCYCAVEAALMEHQVTRTKVKGGSVGGTIRVAKGLTVRGSRFRAESMPERELVPVSIGRLFITNRRIVYRGNAKSFNISLDRILGIETFADGARITTEDEGRPRIVQFTDRASADEVREVLGALFSGANAG